MKPNLHRSAAAIGWGLVAAWVIWWVQNLFADHLVGPDTWFFAWPYLGTDFLHNFRAVHLLAHGGNPYRQDFGDYRGLYAYPPVVLGLFFWCALIPLSMKLAAVYLWTTAVGSAVMIAARMAWVKRTARGLSPLPWGLAVGIVLWSTPVVFAMERGNCDALVLVLLALAAAMIERRTKSADITAGICLALGMWIKIYPGLVLVAAVALRRWRVVNAGVIAAIVIAVTPLPATIQFFQTSMNYGGYRTKFIASALHLNADPARAKSSAATSYPPLEPASHSLPIYWRTFWASMGLPAVARVPGVIGSGIILAPVLAWVFLGVRRAVDPAPMAYPYFLWVAAAATFWMPVSYDYNLIFLPVLAVAVWDARDGVLVHALLLPFLIYWQPFRLNIPMELLLLFKLMALGGLGICVVRRARRLPA